MHKENRISVDSSQICEIPVLVRFMGQGERFENTKRANKDALLSILF